MGGMRLPVAVAISAQLACLPSRFVNTAVRVLHLGSKVCLVLIPALATGILLPSSGPSL